MKINTFFRLNLAGKGYTDLWPGRAEKAPLLDKRDIDESLPEPDVRDSEPVVAYSATLFNANAKRIFIVVGSYWAQHADEYGRKGLFLYHGVLCECNELSHKNLLIISDLLIGIVNRHENGSAIIGKRIARLATDKKNLNNHLESIAHLARNIPTIINESAKEMILTFWKNCMEISDKTNIRIGFPLHEYLEIPALIGLMSKYPKFSRIAGGKLALTQIDSYQYVSSSSDLPGYYNKDVSDLFCPRKPSNYDMESSYGQIGQIPSSQRTETISDRYNQASQKPYIDFIRCIKVRVIAEEFGNIDIIVPVDIVLKTLLAEIISKLELPLENSTGRSVRYEINSRDLGTILRGRKTLAKVGIKDDDILTVIADPGKERLSEDGSEEKNTYPISARYKTIRRLVMFIIILAMLLSECK